VQARVCLECQTQLRSRFDNRQQCAGSVFNYDVNSMYCHSRGETEGTYGRPYTRQPAAILQKSAVTVYFDVLLQYQEDSRHVWLLLGSTTGSSLVRMAD